MHKDNIEKLQRKVKKLLEASSDEQSYERSSKQEKHSEVETVRKCIQLINENKQLKKELQKQKERTLRIGQQLRNERERFSKIERSLNDELKSLKFNDRKRFEEDVTVRNTKNEMEVEIMRKRMKDLESMVSNERKKCRRLTNFIKKELPSLQQTMAVLTGKMDTKLQKFFLKQFQN